MVFFMHLYDDPFRKIATGRKTVELRLYDEKRRNLNVGDYIVFTNITDHNVCIVARITALYRYSSFEELFQEISPEVCGEEAEISAKEAAAKLRKYYSKDQEDWYGVLGIRIEPLTMFDSWRKFKDDKALIISVEEYGAGPSLIKSCKEIGFSEKNIVLCETKEAVKALLPDKNVNVFPLFSFIYIGEGNTYQMLDLITMIEGTEYSRMFLDFLRFFYSKSISEIKKIKTEYKQLGWIDNKSILSWDPEETLELHNAYYRDVRTIEDLAFFLEVVSNSNARLLIYDGIGEVSNYILSP